MLDLLVCLKALRGVMQEADRSDALRPREKTYFQGQDASSILQCTVQVCYPVLEHAIVFYIPSGNAEPNGPSALNLIY